MDKTDGTFLLSSITLESNIPGAAFSSLDQDDQLWVAWSSHQPQEIEAGTTYTSVLISRPGVAIDEGAESLETYGVRLSSCGDSEICVVVPLHQCSLANTALVLFNSQHPDGIFRLGDHYGDCWGGYNLYIPFVN